jgi:hypothetical protein
MDENATKQFVQESIRRLRRMTPILGVSEDKVEIANGDIFVPVPSTKHNRPFMIRARPDGEYPTSPSDYVFVDPTAKGEGVQFWPNDGGQAFKLDNPPWICMAGTKGWIQHGHPNPGPRVNLIENVVYSIFVKLNKQS